MKMRGFWWTIISIGEDLNPLRVGSQPALGFTSCVARFDLFQAVLAKTEQSSTRWLVGFFTPRPNPEFTRCKDLGLTGTDWDGLANRYWQAAVKTQIDLPHSLISSLACTAVLAEMPHERKQQNWGIFHQPTSFRRGSLGSERWRVRVRTVCHGHMPALVHVERTLVNFGFSCMFMTAFVVHHIIPVVRRSNKPSDNPENELKFNQSNR